MGIGESDDKASATASPNRSIDACPKVSEGKANNCVSTSNTKQLDLYSPPWTFEVSADEAFARLKGVVAADPNTAITEVDPVNRYLKAEAQRAWGDVDLLEFLVKAEDKVVIFKASERDPSNTSDFGFNRKRIEGLRKQSGGVFAVMGEGTTADSIYYTTGTQKGVLGQLKAFYGLQSGEGFEDVFEEE